MMEKLCEDVGAELSGLIYHLYKEYGLENGFYELCLRTYFPYTPEDDMLKPVTLSKLPQTLWYTHIVERYKEKCRNLKWIHEEKFEQAGAITSVFYVRGCPLSEYAEAISSCVSLLDFSIPDAIVTRFLNKKAIILDKSESYTISTEQLVEDVLELVHDSLMPRFWWCMNNNDDNIDGSKGGESAVRAEIEINGFSSPTMVHPTRVGLVCDPPTILIEYPSTGSRSAASSSSDNQNLRCRRIHLPDEVLEEHFPLGSTARRLATSHGIFLTYSMFQKVLLELQKLKKQRLAALKEEAESKENITRANAHSSSSFRDSSGIREGVSSAGNTSLPTKEEETREIVNKTKEKNNFNDTSQEADLCLLYRDPEAALINVDLNKADDETVKEYKGVMDIKFKEKALKPGDVGYVYDKRVEVKPTEKSEWDDDSD